MDYIRQGHEALTLEAHFICETPWAEVAAASIILIDPEGVQTEYGADIDALNNKISHTFSPAEQPFPFTEKTGMFIFIGKLTLNTGLVAFGYSEGKFEVVPFISVT